MRRRMGMQALVTFAHWQAELTEDAPLSRILAQAHLDLLQRCVRGELSPKQAMAKLDRLGALAEEVSNERISTGVE